MRPRPRCPSCGWREDVFMVSREPPLWSAGCPMCMTYMSGPTPEEARRRFVEYCEATGRTGHARRRGAC